MRRTTGRSEPLDQRHLVAWLVVSHFIDHSLADQEAESAGTKAQLLADVQVRERIVGDGGVGQRRAVETRPLVADHDFQVVFVDAVRDLDQAIGLVQVAPLDGVVGHLHDRLAQLHDLLVRERRGLADEHEKVVEVLEEVDLAVELDVDLALEARCSMLARQARAAVMASNRSSTP